MIVLIGEDANPAILADELMLINAAYAAVSASGASARHLSITSLHGEYALLITLQEQGIFYLQTTQRGFTAYMTEHAPLDAFASLVSTLKPKKHYTV